MMRRLGPLRQRVLPTELDLTIPHWYGHCALFVRLPYQVYQRLPENITSIEMFIQKLHEGLVASFLHDQTRDIVDDVEGICPHIPFCPADILSSPNATDIPGFHESGGVIEDIERGFQSPDTEELRVVGFVQNGRQDGDGVIVV